ncbi:ABC transporter substrate-binding protein [Bradyrhizobium sp. WSM 1704]|uniref:ABC transporter substrate-binding protein n=1 Tax=Bradyrhizobium semiaridum TaxID=2821404 RepID=UPI001CE300F0|nr:ABC transporter substrate-binding protein [Bradyrhizobium semiaridum]MCA6125756.1 ABC transporter substrate-binding protein [Bradyrhizobium semiaridum]
MRFAKAVLAVLCMIASMCDLSNAQPAPRKVGILINGGPSPIFDSIKKNLLSDFAERGYLEGRDVVIEPRFAELKLERLPSLASELVAANVDVILALGGPAAVAAQKTTSTIPVIFAIVTDPVALKLVASMERPGGNITGLTSLDPQQASKQFELLKEAFPGIKRVAILSDQTLPGADERGLAPIDRANEAAAKALGLEPQIVKVKSADDLESAIAGMASDRAEAMLVLEVPVPLSNRKRVGELAVKSRLPAMFPGGQADAGGVVTYGTNVADTWREFATFADEIFKGAKPGDLPVRVITKQELIFNLQAAQAVGVRIPPELLKRADKIMQ